MPTTWNAALISATHRAVLEAMHTGDLQAEVDGVRQLRDLHEGHPRHAHLQRTVARLEKYKREQDEQDNAPPARRQRTAAPPDATPPDATPPAATPPVAWGARTLGEALQNVTVGSALDPSTTHVTLPPHHVAGDVASVMDWA